MQNQSRDWLIAAITFGVGLTATVVIPSSKVGSVLLGTTPGAVIGAAVLNKRHEADQKKLGEQVLGQEERQRLRAELPRLEARVNQLQQEQIALARISGQLTQRQEQNRAIGSAIANLTPQKQDLEQQVAVRSSKLAWVKAQLVQEQSELQELNHQHEIARQNLEALFQQQGVTEERLSTPQAKLVSINAQLSALSPFTLARQDRDCCTR